MSAPWARTDRYISGDQAGRIVNSEGRHTGFCVSGISCLRVVTMEGVQTGYYIAGTLKPVVLDAQGNDTGFLICGQLRREFVGPEQTVPWERGSTRESTGRPTVRFAPAKH